MQFKAYILSTVVQMSPDCPFVFNRLFIKHKATSLAL